MRQFPVTTDRDDNTGIAEFAERVLNGPWVPEHLTPEEAAEFARGVLADLVARLNIACEPSPDFCLQARPTP